MTHFEETLQRDIERIRSKIADMAALAEKALTSCLQALADRNRQLAYSVILRDQWIDELEREIDRLCLEFLVRQQPVGGPLRFAYVTIKINMELERVGDYAESIARHALRLSSLDIDIPYDRFAEIANLAIPMLRNAIRAFLNQDPDMARRTMDVEDQVDILRTRIDAEIVNLRQENKIPTEALSPLTTIVHRFERVADQAKSICQQTMYMCNGEYLRQRGGEAYRVLFVDDNNHCRSVMAEAIANSLGQSRFIFNSAGLATQPVDTTTLAFLKDKGFDVTRHTPKTADQVPNLDHYQVLVALAKAAHRVFPLPPTKAVCLDWTVGDPSIVEGNPEIVRAAYEETFAFLREQIVDLVEAILGEKTA